MWKIVLHSQIIEIWSPPITKCLLHISVSGGAHISEYLIKQISRGFKSLCIGLEIGHISFIFCQTSTAKTVCYLFSLFNCVGWIWGLYRSNISLGGKIKTEMQSHKFLGRYRVFLLLWTVKTVLCHRNKLERFLCLIRNSEKEQVSLQHHCL